MRTLRLTNRPGPRKNNSRKPVICVTMGYPSGIGPQIILKALASTDIRRLANFLIIGDRSVLDKAGALADRNISYKTIYSVRDIDFSKTGIIVYDLNNIARKSFNFGELSADYGRASIDYIARAVSLIRQAKCDALVTAPIHKHAAKLSGFRYPGHTEYLAHLSKTKKYAMMLTGGSLKVILVTTHLPLKDVPRKVNQKRIEDIIALANTSLRQYFGIPRPKIAICGLNPHAGEDGALGNEEKRVIAPAVKSAKKKGANVFGPIAADALFYDAQRGKYDACVCMYHDQGLVALKMAARDTSVNITLGLSFIRTSPGHGTALDIAKKGTASETSMKEAIKRAVAMFKNKPLSPAGSNP